MRARKKLSDRRGRNSDDDGGEGLNQKEWNEKERQESNSHELEDPPSMPFPYRSNPRARSNREKGSSRRNPQNQI